MKIEKLFKKAEKFFGMERDEQIKKTKKSKKLLASIEEKIALIKDKIKNSKNSDKKEEHKRELKVLQQLEEDCKSVSKENSEE